MQQCLTTINHGGKTVTCSHVVSQSVDCCIYVQQSSVDCRAGRHMYNATTLAAMLCIERGTLSPSSNCVRFCVPNFSGDAMGGRISAAFGFLKCCASIAVRVVENEVTKLPLRLKWGPSFWRAGAAGLSGLSGFHVLRPPPFKWA